MRNFEWESEKPLYAEVAAKFAAVFGLFLAGAIWLAMFKYWVLAAGVFMAGLITALIFVKRTSKTKISVDGFALKYGTSTIINLKRIKKIKVTKQFGVEEVIAIFGNPGGVVPLKGVPKEIQAELVEILNERINAS